MSHTENLTVEILKQIRSDLKEGLDGLRGEVQKTNERLEQTNSRLENIRDMQDLLVHEHRKTNHRLDFFAEELVGMRTKDNERISVLESAVAELQRKVG